MRHYRSAFTFVEILVTISIIGLLAALSYALMPSALLSAKTASTKSKLHQLHTSIELYRNDYNGGQIGDLGDLGLPPVFAIATGATRYLGLPSEIWVSSCAPHPHSHPPITTMFYFPGEGGSKLTKASSDLQDSLLLISDNTCNAPEILIQSPYVTKRGLGLLLNGTLVDRRAIGDTHDPYWFARTNFLSQ